MKPRIEIRVALDADAGQDGWQTALVYSLLDEEQRIELVPYFLEDIQRDDEGVILIPKIISEALVSAEFALPVIVTHGDETNFAVIDTDAPSLDLSIVAYIHCSLCLEESQAIGLPVSKLAVGFTPVGLQVWCERHNANIVHIDFQGSQHPANIQTRKIDASAN